MFFVHLINHQKSIVKIMMMIVKSVCRNTLIPSDWDILKELYILIKLFHEFTAYMKDYTTIDTYRALWKVLLAIKLVILECKNFAIVYVTLALSSN